jgi:hypothetical protein
MLWKKSMVGCYQFGADRFSIDHSYLTSTIELTDD